ncbi:Paired box domain-containing protein [Ditylenchus destructor]|nr:Paired box domain-containing protein [Ditylenchus destructor]
MFPFNQLLTIGPTEVQQTHQENKKKSARNRFGRPYISGRPLLACDRRRIIQLYQQGLRKIAIAREIGVTHSCVSKVIRKFEATGEVQNATFAQTASCACPGQADSHDPRVCRHIKYEPKINMANVDKPRTICGAEHSTIKCNMSQRSALKCKTKPTRFSVDCLAQRMKPYIWLGPIPKLVWGPISKPQA